MVLPALALAGPASNMQQSRNKHRTLYPLSPSPAPILERTCQFHHNRSVFAVAAPKTGLYIEHGGDLPSNICG